tara:strand:- start:121 stop:498 length:378 start_codon:yes stop_codon:yes gene_type:complete
MNYLLGLTITGLVSGILAGLIGAGSEILIVPLLTIFGILTSLKTRIGTSLIMLLPPIGIFAAIKFYKSGNADIFAGLYMGLIFTIFSLISSYYSLKMNPLILRKIFGIFTILAGIYIYFTNENKE